MSRPKYLYLKIWKLKDTRGGNIVRPQLSAEFEATKQQWLAWDKWSKGTRSGDTRSCSNSNVMMMIALCSKCYNVDEQNSEEKNFSTKACRRGRTKSPGIALKRHSMAAPIEQKTEDFEWLTADGYI